MLVLIKWTRLPPIETAVYPCPASSATGRNGPSLRSGQRWDEAFPLEGISWRCDAAKDGRECFSGNNPAPKKPEAIPGPHAMAANDDLTEEVELDTDHLAQIGN
jgi:hypothetical protein